METGKTKQTKISFVSVIVNHLETHSRKLELENEDPIYKLIRVHAKEGLTPICQFYTGMGHFTVIIADSEKNYHPISMGGSNAHQSIQKVVSFLLYEFDHPAGKLSDFEKNFVLEDPVETFTLEMKKSINEIFWDMYVETTCESELEFYTSFVAAIQERMNDDSFVENLLDDAQDTRCTGYPRCTGYTRCTKCTRCTRCTKCTRCTRYPICTICTGYPICTK